MWYLQLSLPVGQVACRALLFDMDGVLVDSQLLIERHLRNWANRNELDPNHVVAASHGRTNEELVRVVAPHLDAVTEGKLLVAEDLRDVANLAPCRGAQSLVEALPARTWAIVTSAYQPVALARLGEAGLPLPEVMVTADDVTAGKPAPDPYLMAAHRLGVPIRDCIVVEDAPAGVAAARAADARVIGVATTDGYVLDADFTVANLTQVRLLRTVPRFPTPNG